MLFLPLRGCSECCQVGGVCGDPVWEECNGEWDYGLECEPYYAVCCVPNNPPTEPTTTTTEGTTTTDGGPPVGSTGTSEPGEPKGMC